MSANDLILLNQLLDQRLSEIGEGLSESEYFEIFASEQLLKDEDLSYDELAAGVVDRGGDGGIDSFFFFVNNGLFSEDVDLSVLKRNLPLRVVLIQSKTSPGFTENAIEKMISSARDLFNLNKELDSLEGVYHQDLIERVGAFRNAFIALTSKFPSLKFEYAYATKGAEVHPNVARKVEVLEQTIPTTTFSA